jgi:hypothetical protein
MSQATLREHGGTTSRAIWFRAGAVFVIGVVAAVIIYLSLRDNGSSATPPTAPSTIVSVSDLQTLAQSINHPIFWVGPRNGIQYELTKLSNGTMIVRYLPAGVAAGAAKPYLSVATYPYSGAYAAMQAVGRQQGSTTVKLAGGGLAVVSTSQPENVHAAFPGVDYQAEVFAPKAGSAEALVAGGKLAAFGSLSPTTPTPEAMTEARLSQLATSVKHPIYWLGPAANRTLEVTQASGGQIYVRYLPKGVALGSKQRYTTVATYPYKGAYAAISALAKQNASGTISIRDNGLAVVDSANPNSIHLAFKGVNYQVEVFSPSASAARRFVTTGKVVTVP